jgi:hypothetical protein
MEFSSCSVRNSSSDIKESLKTFLFKTFCPTLVCTIPPTANLLTVKLLLNSIISTKDVQFMTMDIKDFYLNTLMAGYEYMHLRLSDMPEDVIEHYKLHELATSDSFFSLLTSQSL